METSGKLTVIAGRPATGKTKLRKALVERRGMQNAFTAEFEGDFSEKIGEAAAQHRYDVLVVEDVPSKERAAMTETLKVLKAFAAEYGVSLIVTLTLSRRYLKEGKLDRGRVKADLRPLCDELFLLDRPVDGASAGKTEVLFVRGGEALFFWE